VKRSEAGKETVNLPSGQVFVAPGVAPQAAGYVDAVRKRRELRKHTASSGGAHVAIPRLDGDVHEGLTMAQHAQLQRAAAAQPAQVDTPRMETSIVEMPSVASMTPPSPGALHPASLGILPMDTLPVEASSDPAFKRGHGSMYAAAQPELAMRYGIVRNGVHLQPHQLRGSKGPAKTLSPASVKDLETLQKLQQQKDGSTLVSNLKEREEDVDDTLDGSAAAASARAGNLPGDMEHMPTKRRAPKEKRKEEKVDIDELDFDQFRQRMMRDILNNEGQKDIIESELDPLSIEDLILRNRVTQKVPIVKGFHVTYQSMTGEEDLALKRLIMEESTAVDISDRYLLDKYAIMSMAVGIAAVNGKPLGEHTNGSGDFDTDLFWKKFRRVLKLPTHMLASIGCNHFWFEQRVRKLFVAEKVGNG